ncbi:V-type ATP synthase subunit A [Flexibacterium corallicola]|uniref:V-type ATP synthase subunit A n=1 Tax=Flexibacterium corallicola TaxID=3037259 RepID=UPI00286EF483|nr:V-type ATP synthase subunit A [Pseudovibrio sp. M1P-2-3]
MDTTKWNAHVVAVEDGLVTIESDGTQPLIKNEVIYICPASMEAEADTSTNTTKIIGEVLRVQGNRAQAQIFEAGYGLAIGDPVLQSGEMLSVKLGPGLLGRVYDGLQNPLYDLTSKYGYFLPRGQREPALPQEKKWSFQAIVKDGDEVKAGDVLGTVQEGRFVHKILVPFDVLETLQVAWIQEGTFSVNVPIISLEASSGGSIEITMEQSWPVKKAIPETLLKRGLVKREYPKTPVATTLRLIDTFFPIARGGTACIPGPFGAGKTVLQSLISRYADVDIVIVVACGERAGEVVETITEFPKMVDPKTGGSLMDRTIIICNTSAMPVAAREASIYSGITIGEYYRQMGYNVLLIADSTSRWAQAMRETSGRMEEIPGEEGFPAYLTSAIKGVYERAGIITNPDNSVGSLTMIGTVSPAGGNFEEPVTQATLSTVKTFLGLSANRAYKRFYPSIDPLISWSRYHQQLAEWFETNMGSDWPRQVIELMELLQRGDDVFQMMQVTGEDGVTLEDFITYQKALLVDMTYLQQDAFDPVDVSVPLERQKEQLELLCQIVERNYAIEEKEAVRSFFTKLTGIMRNLNYAPWKSSPYKNYREQIGELLSSASPQAA